MSAIEILEAARDAKLNPGHIETLLLLMKTGGINDAQLAAFLMAARTRGMSRESAAALCIGLAGSGVTMRWEYEGVVDKHSTGGVGDKTSLVLAPLLAAVGCRVPMISGRSLGLTGGTLDKLEAIEGFNVAPDVASLGGQLEKVGCFIAAAVAGIAPADARLYGLRDVTATIDSIPLIASSILSKKLAAGVENLVIDVKWGTGAFMGTKQAAQELADELCAIGEGCGMQVKPYLSPMNVPLGSGVGNCAEVEESVDVLQGQKGPVRELVLTLAEQAVNLAGVGKTRTELEKALDGGTAWGKFEAMCHSQGVEKFAVLTPTLKQEVIATESRTGMFSSPLVAQAAQVLRASRKSYDTKVSPEASIWLHAAPGASVRKGDTIATVGGVDAAEVAAAAMVMRNAWVDFEPQPEGEWF